MACDQVHHYFFFETPFFHLTFRTLSHFDFLAVVWTSTIVSLLLVLYPLPEFERLKYLSILILDLYSTHTKFLDDFIQPHRFKYYLYADSNKLVSKTLLLVLHICCLFIISAWMPQGTSKLNKSWNNLFIFPHKMLLCLLQLRKQQLHSSSGLKVWMLIIFFLSHSTTNSLASPVRSTLEKYP